MELEFLALASELKYFGIDKITYCKIYFNSWNNLRFMTHMYFKLPLLDFNSADELLCSCVSDGIFPSSNTRLWYSGLCLGSNEGVRSLSSPVAINSFEIWD